MQLEICSKMKIIGTKHSNDVAQDVKTPGELTFFAIFHQYHILLQFEHKDDAKIIIGSHKTTHLRRSGLYKSLTMIMSHSKIKNLLEYNLSWDKYEI